MIVLRKLGSQLTGVIISDELSGTLNGSNKTFTVSYDYKPDRIEIIYNGEVLVSPDDFTETGSNEIEFVSLTPTSGTILRANYEALNYYDGNNHDDIPHYFTSLFDAPHSYVGQAGKIVGVKSDELGLEFTDPVTSFIENTDTPTTYSGSEGYFVRVKSDGTGLEFLPPPEYQEGITNLPQGICSTSITFSSPFSSSDYVVHTSLVNMVDPNPAIYPSVITETTVSGFTVDFSGEIDSSNYYLNWSASLSGTYGSTSYGSSGASNFELAQDSTPELSNDLEVGSHALMLDTTPSGNVLHGYTVGYSGEASNMYVLRNDTGVGCPLYMRTDGKWYQCTAASGTTQMPCGALALEEGDGAVKKILWKGIIRKGSWTWTPGDIIYVSTVAGSLTNAVANSGAWVQPIGLAIASDTIRFDPGFYTGYINS